MLGLEDAVSGPVAADVDDLDGLCDQLAHDAGSMEHAEGAD